jgi:uncharacterized protein (DUF1778 family)
MAKGTVMPAPRLALNLRIRPEDRGLIDRAAATKGQTRTGFVLDAARRAAEDTLIDRRITAASPRAYAAFLARLDAPARPNARLKRTMRARPPWR